jgi:hypothetical protein
MKRFLNKYLEICFWLGEQIACCIAVFTPVGIIYYLLDILEGIILTFD